MSFCDEAGRGWVWFKTGASISVALIGIVWALSALAGREPSEWEQKIYKCGSEGMQRKGKGPLVIVDKQFADDSDAFRFIKEVEASSGRHISADLCKLGFGVMPGFNLGVGENEQAGFLLSTKAKPQPGTIPAEWADVYACANDSSSGERLARKSPEYGPEHVADGIRCGGHEVIWRKLIPAREARSLAESLRGLSNSVTLDPGGYMIVLGHTLSKSEEDAVKAAARASKIPIKVLRDAYVTERDI